MRTVTVLCLCVVLRIVYTQLVFPVNPTQRLDSENTTGRVPLYAPNLCPENQLLYPGDQKSDWICDCGPSFIYYPPRDACYAAYRQGPCTAGDYLIIKENQFIPECDKNPCQDGFALSGGTCFEMGKPNGPCAPLNAGGGIFDVNSTTLKVECLKGSDRLSLLGEIPRNNPCPVGSKRGADGKCRRVFNKT